MGYSDKYSFPAVLIAYKAAAFEVDDRQLQGNKVMLQVYMPEFLER